MAEAKSLTSPFMNMQDKRSRKELSVDNQEFSFGSGEPATTLQIHHVRMLNNGTLPGAVNVLDERTGRLREVLDLSVHFIRDGVRVASSKVSKDGTFIAAGLTPGVHSVAAVGQDGVMVVAVEIVGSANEVDSVQNGESGEFTPVSIPSSLMIQAEICGSPVSRDNLSALSSGSQRNCGFVGGSGGCTAGGGGFSGGFGGGGGGLGLGAFHAGGLGAGIGYAVGHHNNNNEKTPTSPDI